MIGMFLDRKLTRIRKSANALGKYVIEDEAEFTCRYERKLERVAGTQGERIIERHLIYTAPGADVQTNDRIVVDGVSGTGGNPDEWAVKSVFHARGFGPSHLEIFV